MFRKVNNEWVESTFESFKPWSASSGPSHKVVWVRCYGLPLPLWNEECFTKLIEALAPSAMLVGIDSYTKAWGNLEFARLQIRILKCERARMPECVRINNQLCNILIEEENPGWVGVSGRIVTPSSVSSESVSSSETYIEETIFSGMEGEDEYRLWRGEEHLLKCEREGKKVIEEDDEQYLNKSKRLFVGSPSNIRGCQWKGGKSLMKGESQSQKGCADADLISFSDEDCGVGGYGKPIQAELAKLVIELECGNCSPVISGPSNLGKKKVAQIVGAWDALLAQSEAGDEVDGKKADKGVYGSKDATPTSLVGREGLAGDPGEAHGESKSWALSHEPSVIRRVQDSGSCSRKEESVEEQDGSRRATARAPSEPLAVMEREVQHCKPISPQRLSKKKVPGGAGESQAHLRRSTRISERRSQVSSYPCNRAGLSVASISDRDIRNCNSRMVARSNIVDSPELWAIGKKIGLGCREYEQEVVKDYDGMEVRDSEMMPGHKEGNENSVL